MSIEHCPFIYTVSIEVNASFSREKSRCYLHLSTVNLFTFKARMLRSFTNKHAARPTVNDLIYEYPDNLIRTLGSASNSKGHIVPFVLNSRLLYVY